MVVYKRNSIYYVRKRRKRHTINDMCQNFMNSFSEKFNMRNNRKAVRIIAYVYEGVWNTHDMLKQDILHLSRYLFNQLYCSRAVIWFSIVKN